jgi:hypothetical protein
MADARQAAPVCAYGEATIEARDHRLAEAGYQDSGGAHEARTAGSLQQLPSPALCSNVQRLQRADRAENGVTHPLTT